MSCEDSMPTHFQTKVPAVPKMVFLWRIHFKVDLNVFFFNSLKISLLVVCQWNW